MRLSLHYIYIQGAKIPVRSKTTPKSVTNLIRVNLLLSLRLYGGIYGRFHQTEALDASLRYSLGGLFNLLLI